MGQALYRKYRSKKLSEVIGQEHITATLTQALKNGKTSHAYLFTGPRGVGKTSVARILAHELNQLPYRDDAAHIDIIEIDAASNRRIDEIRELREKVAVAPASAKYKVYIIDEVHMLTREAFNALLKTLEEPPAHVVFILATTDAHKLPDTIVSRTQRFTFLPVPREQVAAHLRTIAQAEGIKIDDEALELLAEHGQGSFRDSISLLDQAGSHGKKLNAAAVADLIGLPTQQSLEQLYAAFRKQSSAQLMQQLATLYNQGYAPATIAREFAALLRTKLLAGASDTAMLGVLERLLEVASSPEPGRLLEIILLKFQPSAASSVKTEPSRAAAEQQTPPETPQADTQKKATSKSAAPTTTSQVATPPATASQLNLSVWPQILNMLKQRYNTLYGVIRMAEPEFIDEQHVRLKFAFAFHQKRISESSNRQVLIGIIKELTGQTVSVECVHSKTATPPKLTSPATRPVPVAGTIDTISNIFGGGELLES